MSLSKDNNEFVSFLRSETDQNIMTNNSLWIHIESRNIFYDNFNTNENLCSFLLAHQDEFKQVIPKRISYHYLPTFSIDKAEKLDLLSNKNSKYLLYKFHDWIKLLGAEKILIRHSSKAKDSIKIE